MIKSTAARICYTESSHANYNVQLLDKNDFDGEYYYCGNGKFFMNLEEAVRYAYSNAFHIEFDLEEDPAQNVSVDLEHFYDFIFLTEKDFLATYDYMDEKEVHKLYEEYKNVPSSQRKHIILALANKLMKEEE